IRQRETQMGLPFLFVRATGGGRLAGVKCPRTPTPPHPEARVSPSPFRLAVALTLVAPPVAVTADAPLQLTLRSRAAAPGRAPGAVAERGAGGTPKKPAIIVCARGDQHGCASAERRVGELAGPMNEMLKAARAKGVLIIHAPSTCTGFYKDTPQRKRAQA